MKAEIQKGLEYGALMGDDESIRILFQHGAKYSKAAYDNAMNTTTKRGEGGHTLCAVYIKHVGLKKTVDPKVPLSKLKMSD
jgi:hypothetical protein